MAMQLVSETAVDGVEGPGAPTVFPTLEGWARPNTDHFPGGQPYGDFTGRRAGARVMWHPDP